jgi:hypothetical protein
VDLFNFGGNADAIYDIVGWYPAAGSAVSSGPFGNAGQLVTLPPDRILDTRQTGPTLGTGGSLDLQVTGQGGVLPSGVSAVVLNVTATNTHAPGYLTVWPSGAARPTASNLNFLAEQSVPNLVIAKVGDGGKVSIFNYSGATDVIADVMGYVVDGTVDTKAAGSAFHPLAPYRILDTRAGLGAPTGLGAGQSLDLNVLVAQAGVPAQGVRGVVMNTTATNTTEAGYLTVWPTGLPMPTVSNLNFGPGVSVPNMVVAKVGAGGKVSIYNFAGSTDVVADIVGWFG